MAAYPCSITESYCNLPCGLPCLAEAQLALRYRRCELANATVLVYVCNLINMLQVEGLAPMAQKVQVLLVDDLDGGEATETVSFSIDGTSYEIDLSAANASKLRKEFATYLDHARRASGTGRRRRTRSGPGRERSSEIRAWAKQRGYKVSERGRIPATIITEYDAAH